MSQNVDMKGNTLLVDDVVADGVSLSGGLGGDAEVGTVIESAGGNITIAADDTIAEALQAIADVADPDVG